MKDTIKVAVSPFYGRDEWYDELSTIQFEKDRLGFVKTYVIDLATTDVTNIRKAIRINALILLEGKLPEEEVAPEPPTEPETKPEPEEEEKEEPVVEAKATRKKTAAKK